MRRKIEKIINRIQIIFYWSRSLQSADPYKSPSHNHYRINYRRNPRRILRSFPVPTHRLFFDAYTYMLRRQRIWWVRLWCLSGRSLIQVQTSWHADIRIISGVSNSSTERFRRCIKCMCTREMRLTSSTQINYWRRCQEIHLQLERLCHWWMRGNIYYLTTKNYEVKRMFNHWPKHIILYRRN